MRPHWGEPLLDEACDLLKREFDDPSLTMTQAYVLQATYHLTFGGTRKAWIYLSMVHPWATEEAIGALAHSWSA